MAIVSLFITWNADPNVFTIPGIDWPLRWYGLSWALAFIGSHFFMNRIFKKEGRTDSQLDLLTLYIIIATVLGARLGHCFFYDFDYYSKHLLDVFKVWEGGLASHGGAIGILVGMWLYCRKTKESWLWLFDRLVVVVPLAGMCIRLGNLMNSEIVGKVTDVAWGFRFLKNDEDLANLAQFGTPIPVRHPTQLYEALFYLFLFILFYWLWKNKRNAVGPGFMFGLFCVLMFGFRFLMEFMKENQSAFEDTLPINMGQILSLPFILLGLFMIFRSRSSQRENP